LISRALRMRWRSFDGVPGASDIFMKLLPPEE